MYDRSSDVWVLLLQLLVPLAAAMAGEQAKTVKQRLVALYWSAHQRFYRQMLMASKVGSCAVVRLQHSALVLLLLLQRRAR